MIQMPRFYLETSVFGFYYDEVPRNVDRRESVKTLFHQLELGILNAVTSPVTADELAQTPEPLRTKLLDLLKLVEELDVDEYEVRRLASAYLGERIIPGDYSTDARHVASASVAGVGLLVTLNLKHLANAWAERRLNAINLREGFPLVSIKTPEEVLRYED